MDAETRQRYLAAMGVQAWQLRTPDVVEPPEPVLKTTRVSAIEPRVSTESKAGAPGWEALQQVVSGCTACRLHEQRTQTVLGVGNRSARWLVIGEAPGADEDRLGEPFVGRAGKLLDSMLKAIGTSRKEVYIANIVKCRPPGNRNPQADEAAACRAYLMRQIELIAPHLILALGGVAAHNLLESDERVGQMRGRVHDLNGIPLVVTYHPAYLLRSPQEKASVWQDLQFALAQVQPAE